MKIPYNFKIISGGQTGVDRAALDFAHAKQINSGGWCPKGRWAEDGIISQKYQLQETTSDNIDERTAKNVEEADGTLIICRKRLDTGSLQTIQHCKTFGKPFLLIKEGEENSFNKWMQSNSINILNIAGPRESNEPGIYIFALKILTEIFG